MNAALAENAGSREIFCALSARRVNTSPNSRREEDEDIRTFSRVRKPGHSKMAWPTLPRKDYTGT